MRAWSLHFVFALLMLGIIPALARAKDEIPPLNLTIQPAKAEYMVGEPLHLSVAVTSPTREDSTFSFSANETYSQWIAYQSAQADSGKVIGTSGPVEHWGGIRGLHTTGPDAFRTEVIAHRAVMPRKPGRYRITASVIIHYSGPDGRYTNHTLTGECQVKIVLAKRRTLIDWAEGIYTEFEGKRAAQIAAIRKADKPFPHGLRDALDLAVDYLLACPADIGLPILQKEITKPDGAGWSSRLPFRMDDYPYCEEAIRLLTRAYGSGTGEPYALGILYRMYYESVPSVRGRIEQITGERIAVQLRRQLARGVRPAKVEILD